LPLLFYTLGVMFFVSTAGWGQSAFIPLKIDYTGALSGFFHIDDPDPALYTKPVATFLDRRKTTAARLLVGMGDNFGPEFRASIQPLSDASNPACSMPLSPEALGKPASQVYPRYLYKNENRVPVRAECDNVVRFLMNAGYRAVVPGRDDFLYTSTWLRGIALGLQVASREIGEPSHAAIHNHDHMLEMLAANLRVTWERERDAPEIPRGACGLFFEPDLFKKETTCTGGAASTTTAMSWVDWMDLTLDKGSGVAAAIQFRTEYSKVPEEKGWLMKSSSEKQTLLHGTIMLRMKLMMDQAGQMRSMVAGIDFESIPPPLAGSLKRISRALTVLSSERGYRLPARNDLNGRLMLESDTPNVPDAQGHGREQQPRQSGADAGKTLGSELRDHCGSSDARNDGVFGQDFCTFGQALAEAFGDISRDDLLLDRDALQAGERQMLRTIAKEQKEIGFTVAREDGHNTLLIGLMGQRTMRAISLTNLQLCTKPMLHSETPAADSLGGCWTHPEGSRPGYGRLVGTVTMLDPLHTLLAVLRGAMLTESFDSIVVMAQMPHTEAEDLAAHLLIQVNHLEQMQQMGALKPIVILGAAQQDHMTPSLQVQYDGRKMIPVLTPRPAFNTDDDTLVTPDSTATLTTGSRTASTTKSNPSTGDKLENILNEDTVRYRSDHTTMGLLLQELQKLKFATAGQELLDNRGAPLPADKCDSALDPAQQNRCEAAVKQFLLRRLQLVSNADVVILERRDFFLGQLPAGYDDYQVCPQTPAEAYDSCALRVALDRVMRKENRSERVMMPGKDLTAMMKTAEQVSMEDNSLAPKDVSQQWLTTFGIVQPVSKNLTDVEARSNSFSVPQDGACIGPKGSAEGSTYCVNGQPIVADAAYWVTTSARLANDDVVYQVMKSLAPDYHQVVEDFITGEIAATLWPTTIVRAPATIAAAEAKQQMRPMWHLDVGKVVVSFAARRPEGGNSYVAANFQGSTDSQASAASQQQMAFESLIRFSYELPTHLILWNQSLPVSFGVQSDTEYDREVTGNLRGKPVNPVYSLNSFSAGGFLQMRLPTWRGPHGKWQYTYGKSLPQILLVLSPRQYQQQITANSIFLPYSESSNPNELTVNAPRVTSFVDKIGLRAEANGGSSWWNFDQGSYAEIGYEIGKQNNVLAGISLASETNAPPPCLSSSSTPIPTCFSGYKSTYNFMIDQSTVLTAPVMTSNLRVTGSYWDIHLQKGLSKTAGKTRRGINLTLDTTGNWYTPKTAGRALSTQPQYAFPVALALNVPVFRNLSFSPTYTVFFYASQVTGQGLVDNTYSISVRWYFARDSAVPPRRQLYFQGPTSADQTQSAKTGSR